MFLPYLTGGGAERVIVNLCNKWAKEHYVKFLLLDSTGAYCNEISPDVNIELIPTSKIYIAAWKLFVLVKKEKPDVLLTTLIYPIFFTAFTKLLSGANLKVYCRLSNIPSIEIKLIKSKIIKVFFKNILSIYDGVICQSQDMLNDLNTFSPKVINSTIINNPAFLLNKSDKFLNVERKGFTLIGRLTKQKNISEAIKGCALAKKELNIYGQGELEDQLKALVRDLNAENYIKFHGFQLNVKEIIMKSEAVLLTSQYEGFPNVLLEACALGTPVIVKNSPGGINEIVNIVNGIVYDGDEVELSEILKSFKGCDFTSKYIITDMQDRFSEEKISNEYIKFFGL